MDGKEIRRVRKHLRLTQVQWARICRVRRQTVSEWENSATAVEGPIGALVTLLENEPARIVELCPEWLAPMAPAESAPEAKVECADS